MELNSISPLKPALNRYDDQKLSTGSEENNEFSVLDVLDVCWIGAGSTGLKPAPVLEVLDVTDFSLNLILCGEITKSGVARCYPTL